MIPSIETAKIAMDAIIKVVRVNSTLQFISARHPDIPVKIILTDTLQSISTYHNLNMHRYTLEFKHTKSLQPDIVHIEYNLDTFNWENDAKKIINDTARLV